MEFDLDDPGLLFRSDVLNDPGPLYAELRRRAPIWKVPGQDTYVVTTPSLVREVVGRTDDFSSNLVSLIHRSAEGAPATFDLFPFADRGHVLAVADPPSHTRHRRLVQPHLSPAAIAELEPIVRALAVDALGPLLTDGGGDAVASFADPVPAAVICHLLGMPVAEVDLLVPHLLAVAELLDGLTDTDGMGRAMGAAAELGSMAHSHLDRQRALRPHDRNALSGSLVDAIDGGEITADEGTGVLIQLFTAGTETTQSLTATTIETLARDQHLQGKLRRHPDRVPAALEEVLRTDGPFQFHYRWTPADTLLGGTEIPARSRVLVFWAAANQPETEDQPNGKPHFAFGRGLHFCVGAALARLEARIMITELLATTTAFRLDPLDPPTRRPSIMLRRHACLPLRVEPVGD